MPHARKSENFQLSPDAQRVIAGRIQDESDPEVTAEVRTPEGETRVTASSDVWNELRTVFPLAAFTGSENQIQPTTDSEETE